MPPQRHTTASPDTARDIPGSQPHTLPPPALGRIEAKWPKAVAKITDDREELLAFYDFPAEHWIHLRTTNPIESRSPPSS